MSDETTVPPLFSKTQLRALAADGKPAVGRVGFDLDDLMTGLFEVVLDTMSERLTGSISGLVGITYRPVAVENGLIVLEITGTPDFEYDFDDEVAQG